MVIGKRGSEKYYIIISFILGLLVLGIGLTLIFDIGKNDNLDFEACRNSIIIRANTPKASFADLDLLQLKDSYPLKCKTNVVNIEEKDVENIEKIIGDSLAECWALFGNGDSEVFPAGNIASGDSVCVPCARIHFTEEAKQKLVSDNKDIFVRDILDNRMTQDYSYYSYLRDSGKQFPAFDPASTGEFLFEGEDFFVNPTPRITTPINRIHGSGSRQVNVPEVILPNKINLKNGDILIGYGASISNEPLFGDFLFGDTPKYIPYLFYFQFDQDIDPLLELSKPFIGSTSFCGNWEGIPA